MGDLNVMIWAMVGTMLLLILVSVAVSYYQLIHPWMRAMMAGGKVSLFDIVAMRMRKTPVNLVIDTYITFVQRGETVPIHEIEKCYLAQPGGVHDCHDLIRLVEAEHPGR